jgi:hypothetical protein
MAARQASFYNNLRHMAALTADLRVTTAFLTMAIFALGDYVLQSGSPGREMKHIQPTERNETFISCGAQNQVCTNPAMVSSSSTTSSARHLSKVVHGWEMPKPTRSPTRSGEGTAVWR